MFVCYIVAWDVCDILTFQHFQTAIFPVDSPQFCVEGKDVGHQFYTLKSAQVVTNLQQTCSNAVPTTCQQDVFALLVPSLLTSCERLVDNLLPGC
jgi:hypothetical protein